MAAILPALVAGGGALADGEAFRAGWWALGSGGAALVVLLLLAVFSPYTLLRAVLWMLTRSFYWLRGQGRENLPRRGPVLLVCHRLLFLDWLLLLAAHRRFLRFVLLTPYRPGWLVRRLLRWTGAITIGPGDRAPEVDAALDRAAAALRHGEAVALFAESCQTADGHVLTYSHAFERITRDTQAPIVPVSVDQVWGSLYRFLHGRFTWKWPQELPYRVSVTFGQPLPAGTSAADAVQAVQRLSAECAVRTNALRRPVHRQFVRNAARHPFRPCLIDSTGRIPDLNYGKTLAGSMCLAHLLRPILGDAPAVAIWLPPSVGGVLSNVALALLGKTSVNLNYTASLEVMHSSLKQCSIRHVITAHRFTERVRLELPDGVEAVYLEDLLPQLTLGRRLLSMLAVLLLPGLVLERWVLGLGRHRNTDLATVIFSSGSTGDPKGVMLSHGNIAGNIESLVQAAQLDHDDRLLGVLPFFHSFGYTVTLWTPLQVGASAVHYADPRAAREIGELARKHRCTIYLSTATFLRFCLRKCDPGDFLAVRLLVCGAEKLPPSLAQQFEAKFSVRPLEGYGCTELSPVGAANLPDLVHDGFRVFANRTGTIGPPFPGCAGKVIHPETGEPLPAGEEGMLLMTGPNVMQGYLHKPELTAQVIRETPAAGPHTPSLRWYVTGDMARFDADGFLTLTGRLSRFAKVGGEMVPLERIEEELHELLQTTDRVCSVTCVPDESRGERLVVLYVHQQEVEIAAWCRQLSSRGLPNLWVPSERDFYPVAELPVLGSGKVDLKRVKQLALELARR